MHDIQDNIICIFLSVLGHVAENCIEIFLDVPQMMENSEMTNFVCT